MAAWNHWRPCHKSAVALFHAISLPVVFIQSKWATNLANLCIFMAFVWRGIPEWVAGHFALLRCRLYISPRLKAFCRCLTAVRLRLHTKTLCKLPSLQPHKTHRRSFEILHFCGESLNFAEGLVYSRPKKQLMEISFINNFYWSLQWVL